MSRLPLTLLQLLLLAATTTAIPASTIFARQQSSCDAKGYELCGNDFPDYFCCPEGSRCMSLAGDTTVLCCPEGKECNELGPITCNVRAQDAEQDHTLPLKTTEFNVELKKCGDDGCCPFGFTCDEGQGGKECKKDKDQSKRPGEDEDDNPKSTTSSSTTTSDPTSEPSSDPSSTTGTSPTATNDGSNSGEDSSEDSSEDSGPDTTSIIGGVVGACGILLIVAVILFVCVRKRAKRNPNSTPPPPQPPTTQVLHGRNISGPTNVDLQPGFGRCDFLQKRENEPGEGLDDEVDGLGVVYPQDGRQSRVKRFSSRFSRGSSHFPFGSSSPDPNLPETPIVRIPSHEYVRKGNVSRSSVPPIRSMKPTIRTKSRHLHPETARDIPRQLTPRPPRPSRASDDATSETLIVGFDPEQPQSEEDTGSKKHRSLRGTRWSLMTAATGLAGIGKDKKYVPSGTSPTPF